jgi:SAM-dependent methyltransferase
MEISAGPGRHEEGTVRGGAQHAAVAYDAIAPVYDDFTAHHDYRTWIGSLLAMAEANGLDGETALDVACGTGKSFVPLLDHGWSLTACDISASMVELARAKSGGAVRVEVADMRELPVYGGFDLVFCVDDAINYLHSAAELERTLRGMKDNLAPDGVLLFDSNTITTYRGFFSEHVEIEANGRRMIWDGRGSGEGTVEPGEVSEALFEVEALEPGARPTIPPELHRQRHHPEPEVRAAITAAGLELLALYGHHHDGVPHQPMSEEHHTKAIYVARRARTT